MKTNLELFQEEYNKDLEISMYKARLDVLSKKDLNKEHIEKEVNQLLEKLHKRRIDLAFSYLIVIDDGGF